MIGNSFDVIIVGGGVPGLALALGLAKYTTLSIAILEADEKKAQFDINHYHHRVSAITLASMRFLQALSVWEDVKAMRVSPFTRIQVWQDKKADILQFASNEIAESFLGFIIENNVLQSALLEKITFYPQITYLAPVKLHSVQQTENEIALIANDKRYHAKLVIAADGANSFVREAVNIQTQQYDYAEKAIVATIETEFPHEQVARQVFLPTGPLALLPLLPANKQSIVWTLPNLQAENYLQLSDDDFKATLASAFSHRLGDVTTLSKRFAFPLQKQETTRYVLHRLALIGDAAHTIHPLAGAGINMGLLDAASLLQIIADAETQQRDYASLATLRRYERWRKADNLALLSGVHAIKHLFAAEQSFLQILLATGLNFTNQFTFFKNFFTRYAVGNRAHLPRFCEAGFTA